MLHPFNSLFSKDVLGKPVKGRNVLDFTEARDGGGGSGISWTICRLLAPCFRHNYSSTTHTHTHTHTCTTVLWPSWILSGATWMSRHQKGKTRRVKPIWIYWSKRWWVAVSSAWHMQICTLTQTHDHAIIPPHSFLQAGCPSCCPTNIVKALKSLFS